MSKIKEQINKLENESGIKSHELSNIREQIKRSFPLNVSNFLWKNSSFSYYKYNNNFIWPRFLFVSFSQKKRKNATKMQGTKNKSGI